MTHSINLDAKYTHETVKVIIVVEVDFKEPLGVPAISVHDAWRQSHSCPEVFVHAVC